MSDKDGERAANQVATAPAEILYERYKDALRRGHVAAMRGGVEEALTAYEEASRIAPSRPMARASAGLALARAGRVGEAVDHYDAAVRLAPHDEATRAGRAEALASLGRLAEAAKDLDVVVDARERAGRLTEALDAATQALGLAEARHRRRAVERLVATLEDSQLDEPSREALGGAMRVLDVEVGLLDAEPAPAVAQPDPETDPRTESGTNVDGEPLGVDAHGSVGEPEAAAGPELEPWPDAERVPEEVLKPGPAAAIEPSPAGDVAAASAAIDSAADPVSIAKAAEVALDAGDGSAARARLLELAAAHRAAGRIDAALDACYLALSVAPDDVELHLVLVGLYAQRGWIPVATEKLDLLARLAALDEDLNAGARIAAARARLG